MLEATEYVCPYCDVRWTSSNQNQCWVCDEVGKPWRFVPTTDEEEADALLQLLSANR